MYPDLSLVTVWIFPILGDKLPPGLQVSFNTPLCKMLHERGYGDFREWERREREWVRERREWDLILSSTYFFLVKIQTRDEWYKTKWCGWCQPRERDENKREEETLFQAVVKQESGRKRKREEDGKRQEKKKWWKDGTKKITSSWLSKRFWLAPDLSFLWSSSRYCLFISQLSLSLSHCLFISQLGYCNLRQGKDGDPYLNWVYRSFIFQLIMMMK